MGFLAGHEPKKPQKPQKPKMSKEEKAIADFVKYCKKMHKRDPNLFMAVCEYVKEHRPELYTTLMSHDAWPYITQAHHTEKAHSYKSVLQQ